MGRPEDRPFPFPGRDFNARPFPLTGDGRADGIGKA
jgi:hypothetical protein